MNEFPWIRGNIYLQQIIDSKTGARRARLNVMAPVIGARYVLLEGAFTPGGLNASLEIGWTVQQREDMVNCYGGSTKALHALKQLILESQNSDLRQIRPYCGIGPANQFDHYLPKELFPEFSVHAHNLAPCCSLCNIKKSATWLVNGSRAILYFYVDPLPAAAMLAPKVNWSVNNGLRTPKVTFVLQRRVGLQRRRFRSRDDPLHAVESARAIQGSGP